MRRNAKMQRQKYSKTAARVCCFLLCSNAVFDAFEHRVGCEVWVETKQRIGRGPMLWIGGAGSGLGAV